MENWTFKTAQFIDVDRENIQILWDDDGTEVEEVIPADVENERYIELLKHITLDELHFNTHEWIKDQKRMYREAIREIALEDGLIFDNTDITKMGINYALSKEVPEIEKDKERLFKFKLELFENPVVLGCTDKELKAELRKAETPLDALFAAVSIVKNNS